ncbi:MAG: SPASM domain-containing protein [archaeon]
MTVTVSLDGPPEVHDKYRLSRKDRSPTFNLIWQNIEAVRVVSSEYVSSRIGLHATCWDPPDFVKILDFFISLDDSFALLTLGSVESVGLSEHMLEEHKSQFNYIDAYLLYGIRFVQQVIEGKKPNKILTYIYDKPLRKLFYRNASFSPDRVDLENICLPGEFVLHVDRDGTFYMCERMAGTMPLGNLNDGLDHSLQANSLQVYAQARNNLCYSCWASRVCQPCVSLAKHPNDGISSEGLHLRCNEFLNSRLIDIALFAYLMKNDIERRHELYFNTQIPDT